MLALCSLLLFILSLTSTPGDLSGDMYAEDSINLLKRSGINFEKCETDGIDVFEFGELLMASGLVLLEDVTWISFQGYAYTPVDPYLGL